MPELRRLRPTETAVPRVVRILLLVLLIAVAVTVLFTSVFPWVEERLEQDPTLGGPASQEARSAS
jgi:hypothetical protein